MTLSLVILIFIAGLALQRLLIGLQRRFHMIQVQKSYGVGLDLEAKSATPTFGGVAFMLMAIASVLIFSVMYPYDIEDILTFWSLPIACGMIGFTDDWLKFTKKSSEGFSSLRKLAAQLAAAAVWTSYIMWKGIPGPELLHLPNWLMFPVTVLTIAGMMNAVNITDGLDGLAGGAFLISLVFLGTNFFQPMPIGMPAPVYRNGQHMLIITIMVVSFLFYNKHPARIFMGDTGSHFLGGALAVIFVCEGLMFLIFPLGFIFWIELLSSAIQIFSIRVFKKKVFRMAPLHHHFQRMGWKETTVTKLFLLAHFIGIILTFLLVVNILERLR